MDERETCKKDRHEDSLPCNDDTVALADEVVELTPVVALPPASRVATTNSPKRATVHTSKSRKKTRVAPPIVHPSAKRRGVEVTIDPIVYTKNKISSPARVTRHSAKAMEVNASGNKGSPSGKGGPTDVANQPNMQPQVDNYPVSMLKQVQPTPSPVMNYTKTPPI